MKKGVLVISLILICGFCIFVSASLYNNVISDEKLASLNEKGTTFDTTPLWSLNFKVPDISNNFTISFLDVKQIKSDSSVSWEDNWWYLDNGDEYLGDVSVIYINLTGEGCCSVLAPDGSCAINKVLFDFDPPLEHTLSSKEIWMYDREEQVWGAFLNELTIPFQIELIFNPETGTLLSGLYEGKSIQILNEAGFMSYGEYHTTYGGNEQGSLCL